VVGLIDFIALGKRFVFWTSYTVRGSQMHPYRGDKGAFGWAAFIFGYGCQRSDFIPAFV